MTIKVGEETYYSEEYVKKLQEENEKLKEYERRFNNLKKEHIDTIRRNEDYRGRIDKAIEYIELGLANEEEAEELLDILKGNE